MPRTVRDLLEGIVTLDQLAAAVPPDDDTGPILAAIRETVAARHRRGGQALYPEGAPQSRVVAWEGGFLRFNPAVERIEPIEPEDPGAIELEEVLTGEPAAEEAGARAVRGDPLQAFRATG